MITDSAGRAMGMVPPLNAAMELSLLLDAFRPSDRAEFRRAFGNQAEWSIVIRALKIHVEAWEKASHVDEYEIRRLADWFGRESPKALLEKIGAAFRNDPSAAAQAFKKGLHTRTAAQTHEAAAAG